MGNLLMVQERERLLSRFFRAARIESLDGLRVFEAGCSTGYNLRQLVQWGGRPADMAGIDLDSSAIDYCVAHSPEIRWHSGSADAVPEPDAAFDISLAFTLFSSVPDPAIAAGIADELFRITRPGGWILIYDMRRRSPGNRSVHPITDKTVREWFAGSRVQRRTITLAPPLARLAGARAAWLYGPLAALPPLRTHAMWIIRRGRE
jgi:SAM-dependent methyltransferase